MMTHWLSLFLLTRGHYQFRRWLGALQPKAFYVLPKRIITQECLIFIGTNSQESITVMGLFSQKPLIFILGIHALAKCIYSQQDMQLNIMICIPIRSYFSEQSTRIWDVKTMKRFPHYWHFLELIHFCYFLYHSPRQLWCESTIVLISLNIVTIDNTKTGQRPVCFLWS